MNLTEQEKCARLALWRTKGIGGRRFQELLARYGSAEQLFAIVDGDPDLPVSLRQRLREADWEAAQGDLQWAEAEGRHLLFPGDSFYPTLLAQTDLPPPVLFVIGDPALLSLPQLAIVGSRNPTAVGRQNARDFAAELASAGLVITSGLAYGVDAAAHEGALEKGRTIAVLGHGLDHVYPARHRSLRDRVVANGAVVSEFPIGVGPQPGYFPKRNRIIAGLSLGTLVVEAAARSGSLTTARFATEAGRDVYAIPGSIHNSLARGCHALIKDGAALVETTDDIARVLEPWIVGLRQSLEADEETPGEEAEDLDPLHLDLLQAMEFEPVSIDALIGRTSLTANEVSSMLLILELQGHVASQPGGLYTRTRPAESE